MKQLLSALGVIVSIPVLFGCILLFTALVVYVFDLTGLSALL